MREGHRIFDCYTSTAIICHDFILFEVALFSLRKKIRNSAVTFCFKSNSSPFYLSYGLPYGFS
jgi:hypothetical protein